MTSHPPISVRDFADHVDRLRANGGVRFSQEYESIDPGQQFTWDVANLDENKPKNRYANVIAYDHSRVVLQQLPGIGAGDYINANYADGYRRPSAYVATQGPLPETFADFWRMVWEQRSAVVVMMTKLEERNRVIPQNTTLFINNEYSRESRSHHLGLPYLYALLNDVYVRIIAEA